jgi:tRNA-Thr(GGU) m(6)t(6)A37 methyltransferase TsaA
MSPPEELVCVPIGVVHTPFSDRVSAPRQPRASEATPGTIELVPGRGFEFAVEDLAGWQFVWLLFWFHLNRAWRPKVLPPRSTRRRGVFATRSPHRPNPIGLSVVELVRVDGLTLHVRGLDLVDGTPLLDIKPYVPYTDAIYDARTGWLNEGTERPSAAPRPRDPIAKNEVLFGGAARAALEWLERRGIDLAGPLRTVLEAGAQPHPYRRIRRQGDGLCIALHEWRAHFTLEGCTVTIERITTGYKSGQLLRDRRPALDVHRDFARTFG